MHVTGYLITLNYPLDWEKNQNILNGGGGLFISIGPAGEVRDRVLPKFIAFVIMLRRKTGFMVEGLLKKDAFNAENNDSSF